MGVTRYTKAGIMFPFPPIGQVVREKDAIFLRPPVAAVPMQD
jgi:glycerol-3-phosphate O-acyltransferase